MTLGEKIYKLRTHRGFSQETLGEKLGVSRQSVSKWETDQSVPELDKIVALSEMFQVSTDYLLKNKEGISIGLVSLGLLAFANLAFGLIAFGTVAFGIISMGAFSFGIFSMGAMACGQFAFGASAHGAQVAVGDVARGKIALGYSQAVGTYTEVSNRNPFDYENACRLIEEHVSPGWLFFKTWAKGMVKLF